MEADVRRAFIVAKYSSDWANKLELEKATGQFEFAYLRGLLLLNGASATAFVFVVASGFKGVVRHAPTLFAAALGCWLAGLLVAVVAGQVAYRAQRHFAHQLRFRRYALGIGILGENSPPILGTRRGGERDRRSYARAGDRSARARQRGLVPCRADRLGQRRHIRLRRRARGGFGDQGGLSAGLP